MKKGLRAALWLLVPSVVAVQAAPRQAAAQSDEEKQACVTASEEAQRLRDDHHLTSARERLLVCARETCPQVVRKDCGDWLSEVEASLPSVVLAARQGHNDVLSAKVEMDGKPLVDHLDGRAVFVDPGPHVFRFSAEGQASEERQVVVKEGERNREISVVFGGAVPDPPEPGHTVGPPHDEARKPSLVPVYVAGGVAAVALGSFVYFGLTGKSDVSELRDTCGPTHSCKQEDVDSAKQKLLVADISLGVGIVAAGVATYFLIARSSHSTSEPTAAKTGLHFGAGPTSGGGGAASLTGQF